MTDNLEIRESAASDLGLIETLYPLAFPDENLLPLVKDLMREEAAVLSLLGERGSSLAGHAIFTYCGLTGSRDKAALLGPVAVAPDCQRQGVGSALISAGLQRLEDEGLAFVFVLGDPAYYQRLCFQPNAPVGAPYPLPDAWLGAWQWITFGQSKPPPDATLSVPKPWREPALWGP